MLLDLPGRPGWSHELPHRPYVQEPATSTRLPCPRHSARPGTRQQQQPRTHGHGGIRLNREEHAGALPTGRRRATAPSGRGKQARRCRDRACVIQTTNGHRGSVGTIAYSSKNRSKASRPCVRRYSITAAVPGKAHSAAARSTAWRGVRRTGGHAFTPRAASRPRPPAPSRGGAERGRDRDVLGRGRRAVRCGAVRRAA